jgi:hypothetical protein
VKWKPAYSYKQYTLVEVCSVKVPTVINQIKDGKIIGDKIFFASAMKKQVLDRKAPNRLGADVLCSPAQAEVIDKIASWLTPRWARVTFNFMKIDSPLAEKAMNSIQIGNVQKSLKRFVQLIENNTISEEERAKAHYNLALIYSVMLRKDQCTHHGGLASETLGLNEHVKALLEKCRESE